MKSREDIERVIAHLNGAVTNARLYTLDHMFVKRHIDLVFRELSQLLRIKTDITLVMVGGDLVFENRTIGTGGPQITKFVNTLSESGIERLSFTLGIDKEELACLISGLALSELVIRSSDHITLGKVQLRTAGAPGSSDTGVTDELKEKLSKLSSQRDITVDEVREMSDKIKHNKKIDPRGLEGIVREFLKGFVRGMNPLTILGSIKSSDEYTFTHVVNVCLLTMAQAEFLGFKDNVLYQIGVASALHDTGKLLVPEEIINKPGALTAKERKIIETHTTEGARYILGLSGVPKLAVLGALEHHIHYDGSGYPWIKGDWKPNIVSQMIAISDVFDAMRSRRSYKRALPLNIIIESMMEKRGTAFNPHLIDNFFKLIDREEGSSALPS